jgi:hypothetical protein
MEGAFSKDCFGALHEGAHSQREVFIFLSDRRETSPNPTSPRRPSSTTVHAVLSHLYNCVALTICNI